MPADATRIPRRASVLAALLGGGLAFGLSDWLFEVLSDWGHGDSRVFAVGLFALAFGGPVLQLWASLRTDRGRTRDAVVRITLPLTTAAALGYAVVQHLDDVVGAPIIALQVAATVLTAAAVGVLRPAVPRLPRVDWAAAVVLTVSWAAVATWFLLASATGNDGRSWTSVFWSLVAASALVVGCFAIAGWSSRRLLHPLVATSMAAVVALSVAYAHLAYAHRARPVGWAVSSVEPGSSSFWIRTVGADDCLRGLRAAVTSRTRNRITLRVTLRRDDDCSWPPMTATSALVHLDRPLDGESIVGEKREEPRVQRSLGKDRRLVMPRVVGLSVADARHLLGSGEDRYGVVRVRGVTKHAVVSQDPAAGDPIGPRFGDGGGSERWSRAPIVLTTD
jgi:hypothetical protein